MKLAVIVPTAGREDLLLAALVSLRPAVGEDRWAGVCVVADGVEVSAEIVEEVRRLGGGVVRHALPYGISRSWNAGLRWAIGRGADVALVLNDDVEMPPFAWDEDLLRFFDLRPEVMCVALLDRMTAGMVVPAATPEVGETDLLPQERWGRRPWPAVAGLARLGPESSPYPGGFGEFAAGFRAQFGPCMFAPCRMNGSAFAVRRCAVAEVGYFDERFEWPGCHEDVDYWLRLLLQYGPKSLGTYLGIFIHHLRSATLSAQPRADVEAAVARNGVRLAQKWGAAPGLVEWVRRASTLTHDTPLAQTAPPKIPATFSVPKTVYAEETTCTTGTPS